MTEYLYLDVQKFIPKVGQEKWSNQLFENHNVVGYLVAVFKWFTLAIVQTVTFIIGVKVQSVESMNVMRVDSI